MKHLVLGGSWSASRIKAIRRHIISVAARVIEHGRQIIVRLSSTHPSTVLICQLRHRIQALAHGPAG